VGQKVSHSFCPYLCQISTDFQLFSPETQLSWGGTFSNHVYYKFFRESAGGNVLRIGQYLAKIRTQICGLLFLANPIVLRFHVETQYAWTFTWPLVTFLCVTCHICLYCSCYWQRPQQPSLLKQDRQGVEQMNPRLTSAKSSWAVDEVQICFLIRL